MDAFQSCVQLSQFQWEHCPRCNGRCASALPYAMVPCPSALPCSFAELQPDGCPWLSLWQQSHFLRWEAFGVTLSVDPTYLCSFCFCLRCWQVLGWCIGQPSHLFPKEFLSEESPPASSARLPRCLCSSRGRSPQKGPGQPLAPPPGSAC